MQGELLPQAFGQWGRLARIGDIEFCGASRSDRLRNWLIDRFTTLPPSDVMQVLEHCDSGAEVMFTLAFARRVADLRVIGPKTLAYGADTLELQVPIERSPYTADFIWRHPRGQCLVEIYGQAAHRDRITKDRARHRHLTGLGYVVHYLPAELVVLHPAEGWAALRLREQRRSNLSHQQTRDAA